MADVQIAVIDQQNTQIAVIDQQDTQIVLAAPPETQINVAVPGTQGPAGEGVPQGGIANQVLFKQSGTDYDTAWSEITSAMIGDLEIVNADVSASAAIAGTKISPDFGSQNVVTTGTASAAAFIPSGNTAPSNGLYLPAANQVALSTNGTGRLFIDASGNVGLATNPTDKLSLEVGAANSGVSIYFSGTEVASLRNDAGNATLNANNANLKFETGGDERLRITSTGELKHLGGQAVGSPAVYFAGSAPSNSLYVQATTGNVGIKTNAPNGELDVTGTGDANGGVLVVNDAGAIGVEVVSPQPTILLNETDTTDENYQIRLNSGDLLIQTQTDARTGASTKVTIDSLGKVGIGIAPSRRLSVQNSAVGTEGIALYRNTGDGTLMVGVGQDADGHGEIGVNNTSGTRNVQIRGNGTSYFNGGKVGIATTNPGHPLQVETEGTGTSAGSNSCALFQSKASGRDAHIRFGDSVNSTARIGYLSNNLYAYVNGNERARIDSSGRLLVGTDSSTNVGSGVGAYIQTRFSGSAVALSAVRESGTPIIALGRANGVAAQIVSDNQALGEIRFAGADGTDLESIAASITCEVNGTPAYAATALVNGQTYRIVTVGTTDFTLIGASANTVGTVFTATGAGTGTGTAILNAGNMPGRLVFATTADGSASPTERMTIKADGSVGIGTTSVDEKLEVNGDILVSSGTDATIYLGKGKEGVDGVTKIKSVQTGTDTDELGLAFFVHPSTAGSASSTEAVRITSDGNVGIGATTVAATSKLQVFSGAAGRSVFRHSSGDGGVTIAGAQAASSASLVFGNTWDTENGANFVEEYRLYFDGSNDSLAFKYDNNTSTAMVLNSSGNVGIATTDPQNLLSLGLGSGTTTRILGQYGNNVSTTLEVGAGQASTFRGGMRIAVTDTVAGSVGDSVVSFHTTKDGGGTVQRLTIDEDGKVGIGATDPSYELAFGSGTSNLVSVGTTDAALRLRADGARSLQLYTNGENRLHINSAGNVGIGTATAGVRLGGTCVSVNGASQSSIELLKNGASAGEIYFYGPDNNFRIGNYQATGFLSFATGGASEKLRITSDGKVGIATTSPNSKLHVVTGANAGISVNQTLATGSWNAGDYTQIGLGVNNQDTVQIRAIQSASSASSYASDIAFINRTSNTMSEKLRITSDGKLGIGTVLPVASLHVKNATEGDAYFKANSGDGVTDRGLVIKSGTGAYTGSKHIFDATSSGGQLEFRTAGTSALLIDQSQRVGIGTTDPRSALHVKGADPQLFLEDTGGGPGGKLRAIATDNGAMTFLRYLDNGTLQGEHARFDASGRLLVGATNSTNNANTNDKQAIVLTGGLTGGQSIVSYAGGNSTNTCATIDLKRSRSTIDGTMSAHGAIAGGWKLGELIFSGTDGTSFSPGASISARTDGSAWTTGDTPGVLVFSTTADQASSPTPRVQINSSGALQLLAGCPGIDFSGIQTNAAGMTSETLDSYEEGTWTPTFAGATTPGTPTYGTNGRAGKYNKVGNKVTAWAFIDVTALGGAAGNINITGLPFTVNNTGFGVSGISVGHADGSLGNGVRAYHNTTSLELRNNNAVVAAATGQIYVSITYTT